MVTIILWLLKVVPMLINAYSSLLVIYALMTWLPNATSSPFGQIIARLVEPYLNVFRRLIPSIGMVSFSIIFAILFLRLVENGAVIFLMFLLKLVA